MATGDGDGIGRRKFTLKTAASILAGTGVLGAAEATGATDFTPIGRSDDSSSSGASGGNGTGASTPTDVPGSEVTTEMNGSVADVDTQTPVQQSQTATPTGLDGYGPARTGASIIMPWSAWDEWANNHFSGAYFGTNNFEDMSGDIQSGHPAFDGRPMDAVGTIFDLGDTYTVADVMNQGAFQMHHDNERGAISLYGNVEEMKKNTEGEWYEAFDSWEVKLNEVEKEFLNVHTPENPWNVFFGDKGVHAIKTDDKTVRKNPPKGYEAGVANHAEANLTPMDGELADILDEDFIDYVHERGAQSYTAAINDGNLVGQRAVLAVPGGARIFGVNEDGEYVHQDVEY